MMNGQIVQEKTKDDLLSNAATQIAALAPDDAAAVETSMLTVLTRRPSEEEKQYFTQRLDGTQRGERNPPPWRPVLDVAQQHRVRMEPSARSSEVSRAHGAPARGRACAGTPALVKLAGLSGTPDGSRRWHTCWRARLNCMNLVATGGRHDRLLCCGWPAARASWKRSIRIPAKKYPATRGRSPALHMASNRPKVWNALPSKWARSHWSGR